MVTHCAKAVSDPHCCVGPHDPHWMMPPQPSPEGPHPIRSSAHVMAVHAPPSPAVGTTHFDGAPGPPHRVPSAHVPQLLMMPPHPSPAGPHSIPSWAHVFGTHVPCAPPSPN